MFSNSSKESAESNDSDNVNNKCNWKDNVKLVIILSTLVLLIVFLIMNIKNIYWLIIIGTPAFLEQIGGTYQSFGIVKKVVNSSDSGKLSFKEQTAINILACTL